MALEESVDGLQKLEANGIVTYIDGDLLEQISLRGAIYIDFGTDRFGTTGFSIAIKRNANDPAGCC